MHAAPKPSLYGIAAEYEDAEQILTAANKAREAGYKRMDAYSPFPVHGLADAVGFKDNRLPWLIFFMGVAGTCVGIGLEYYTSVVDYPMNIGGRPLMSWPSFIPVAYECTILLAAFGAVFGMLGLNGLPQPYHSIFNAENFDRASQDRFFLCIEATDPKFDVENTRAFLEGTNPLNVSEVAP
jgi:hypothetical protein